MADAVVWYLYATLQSLVLCKYWHLTEHAIHGGAGDTQVPKDAYSNYTLIVSYFFNSNSQAANKVGAKERASIT